jgi:hypothetical protein
MMRRNNRGRFTFCAALAVAAFAARVAVAAPGAAPASHYEALAWLADYAQLKTILQKADAHLAWYGSFESGIDLPRLDQRTQTALKAATSDEEARVAIEGFVGAFKGGHFSVLASLAPPTGTPAALKAKPFNADNLADACAALGFLPTSPVAFSLPVEGLPNFTLLSDGLSTPYRSGVATAADGRKLGFIRIQNFRLRAFPGACAQALTRLKAKGGAVDRQALRDAAYTTWFTALLDEIKAFSAQGVAALVIDVGNNSGGDDHGDLFPRLLTDRPVRSERLRLIAGPAGVDYADEQISALDGLIATKPAAGALDELSKARAFFAGAKAAVAASARCDLSWVWTSRRPWSDKGCTPLIDGGYAGGYAAGLPKGAFGDQAIAAQLSFPSAADDMWGMWTGPVYVLTDNKTYSSAEMFSAVIQDNHIGKIIGQATGGDGCGFMGDDVAYVLDHSKMRLRIPNCMRLRADGGDDVAGVRPDLPVTPTDGEDNRQRASRLVETIAADLFVTPAR